MPTIKTVTFKSAGTIEKTACTVATLKALIADAIDQGRTKAHYGDIVEVSEKHAQGGGVVAVSRHLGTFVFNPVQHEAPRFFLEPEMR